MGISLILVGVLTLARMVWGTLKLTLAFACVKECVKACQDALWTYVPSKRWFGKFAEIGRKKNAWEWPCQWGGGGGVQSLFGQCPNAFVSNFVGASLRGIYFNGGEKWFFQHSYLLLKVIWKKGFETFFKWVESVRGDRNCERFERGKATGVQPEVKQKYEV